MTVALWLGVLSAPRRTFAELKARSTLAPAASAVAVLGLLYAALYGALAANGHVPSAARGLPVGVDRYYATAALYIAPLCFLLWAIFGAIAHGLVPRAAPYRATMSALGLAWAVPITVFFVVPDFVIFAAAGHPALSLALRITAPFTAVAIVALSTVALEVVHGCGRGRAIAAAVAALIVHSLPAALLIR